MLLDYLQHRRDCRTKQAERVNRIGALKSYHGPFSVLDKEIVNKPIQDLVKEVHENPGKATQILQTYGKVALKAQEKTNCVTEILLDSAEKWVTDGSINLKGPLAGIPVSLKDTVDVTGYDTTVGYSRFVGIKATDGPTARILKDAGAVPYVKTNVPITLLSFESSNDVWGTSTNPYNKNYTPGGSTGGEGALLALGGRIGVGSDVAGSVRCPAHFSGIYSLKCSTGRWLKLGMRTSMPGQDGIPAVYSPMARTLNDLTYFTRSIVQMKPWNYDYSIHPIPWRSDVEEAYAAKKKLRVGVMRTDGVVDPSPACARALEMTVKALRAEGHEIIDNITPPEPYEALQLASQLLDADGVQTAMSFFRTGEGNDCGVAQMRFYFNLPRIVKYAHYLWVRYIRRDLVWAGILRNWHPKTTYQYWQLIAKREAYKRRWFEFWEENGFDFVVTPPNATPAVPHGGMHDACSSCGYTFLFNLLDYTAGVIPVTHVDKEKDQLPKGFEARNLNGVARGAYKHYNADDMHGLPVGVQVVGRRLEEEKVLTLMKRVEDALGDDKFKLLELD
ncbi:acetamidase [Cordyceps javanica]|uniref:amidase n=1 Tax=Cordyceps javanica TaxID=43265 RepID=A0A545V9V0_9HYPO|nr:acetamidase [Cordyceps javanica]TQW09710.1 acetamidase [Cordyceps javanica]